MTRRTAKQRLLSRLESLERGRHFNNLTKRAKLVDNICLSNYPPRNFACSLLPRHGNHEKLR